MTVAYLYSIDGGRSKLWYIPRGSIVLPNIQAQHYLNSLFSGSGVKYLVSRIRINPDPLLFSRIRLLNTP